MDDQVERSIDGAPIACSLTERELSAREEALTADLFRGVEQVNELADGYEYCYPGTDDWAGKLLDFIAFERRCCPFFAFELAFAPNQGPLSLRIRGSAEVKALVRDGLNPSWIANVSARP